MKIKSLLMACAMVALVATSAHAGEQKLFVYTWDTYKDDDLFKEFEKESGIDVVTDIYSSNDALIAKLKAGGAYDIVMPSGAYVPLLAGEKLLMDLPPELRAHGEKMAANVSKPSYDPEYKNSLPLFYGTTGIAVNTKLVKEDITNWQQFFNRPEGEKQHIGVLDDVGTVMDVLAIAHSKPYCEDKPDTFKAFQQTLMKQKPFVKVYSATGYIERLAANDVTLQMAWSGDTYLARKDNKDIKYVYPKEGVEVWVDNIAIPATAKNVDAAKKFVEFVMKPENMAKYAEYTGYVPSLDAAKEKLPDDLKNAPEFNIPAGTSAPVSFNCPAAVVKNHQKIWDNVLK